MTDRRRLSGSSGEDARRRCLIRQAQFAVEAGVDHLQIREPDLDAAPLARLVTECVALARGTRTRVLVNDRVDVALAAGAAGVHLRGDSIPPSRVRALAGPGFIVGRSVHSVEDALAAPAADYVTAGTVWPTTSKPGRHALLGLDGLAEIAAAVTVPVLAIGGVTPERAAAAAGAGAAGVAAITLFMDSAVGTPATPHENRCGAVPLAALAEQIRARFDGVRRVPTP